MFGVWDRVFVHIVWATWERLPLLENHQVRRAVHASIAAKSNELRCEVHAVGGVEDHVHMLTRLHRTVALADLVRDVKGISSHLANHEHQLQPPLRWQRGYAVLSVSPKFVHQVRQYILTQEQHHRHGSEIEALERLAPPEPHERD